MLTRRGLIAGSLASAESGPTTSRTRRFGVLLYESKRERDSTNAVPPHLRRDVSSVIQAVWPPRGGGLISVWPCASEGSSESTLREADVLATLPMYDPGMLASWYRRRYRHLIYPRTTRTHPLSGHMCMCMWRNQGMSHLQRHLKHARPPRRARYPSRSTPPGLAPWNAPPPSAPVRVWKPWSGGGQGKRRVARRRRGAARRGAAGSAAAWLHGAARGGAAVAAHRVFATAGALHPGRLRLLRVDLEQRGLAVGLWRLDGRRHSLRSPLGGWRARGEGLGGRCRG